MKLHKLNSLPVWIDENTKVLYPSDEEGNAIIDSPGISLEEMNWDWFNYLDRDDREYLSNLVNNTNN